MRTLWLGASTATDRDFELVYQSLLFSPLPVQGNERKCHGELLDKLERIGHLKEVFAADGVTRREYGRDEIRLYVTDGGVVDLTEAEYDLVKRHIAAMADTPTFPKASSRAMDALIERVNALPKNADQAA